MFKLFKRHKWKFAESPNTACFSTEQVFKDGKPILHVYHNSDGDWQFHSELEPSMENAMIISLREVVDLDESIQSLYDLPLGGSASRKTKHDGWTRKKNFKKIEIIDLISNRGGCVATDKITVDGASVGYMYREEPVRELDNGWRFFAGDENQEYINDLKNSSVYDTNTIANYDPAIIPYLDLPTGTKLERDTNSNKFNVVSE